jgi:nicotinamide phosphoribosyltransferase
MAHLTSFCGSETIPAIRAIEEYYNADSSKELVAATVPATEHSVMCSGGKEDELETFKRLIKDIYPKGFVSIVSDTWDFWQVIEDFLPKLKKDIMARDGRVVIRPDSGDPVDIICGLRTNSHYLTRIKEGKYYCSYNPFSEDDEWVEVSVGQYYGAYYMLGNIFGWNTTKNGYLYPSEKIGLLYGDSITLERQKQIYLRLEGANMAACNLVLGVGSYTFQYKSRDSLGFAVKATAVRINGRLQEIFKQPKTDDGTKNSLRGLIKVIQADKTYIAVDRVSEEDEKTGCLETVFKDGVLLKDYSLQEIRSRINSTLC